jgi:hypothetical protein
LIVILEQAFFAAKDLGEPREASRSLRRNNRVFGSLPRQTAPPPRSEAPGSILSFK